MTREIVYKVVVCIPNPKTGTHEYYSTLTQTDMRVQYFPKTAVRSVLPGSYLYAFDTLDNAREYRAGGELIANPTSTLQIWKAEANVVCTEPSTVLAHEERFWTEKWYGLEYPPFKLFPTLKGSVWCEWVTLLEMVEGRYPFWKQK